MATLKDLVTGKGFDASQGIIEETIKTVPEVDKFTSILIKGTTFQSVSQTSDPTTGFRTVNNGIDASDEGYELRNYALGILAGLVQRDKAAVDADIRGRDATLTAAAISLVRSGMKSLASKVWYGSSGGAEKFNGCASLVKDSLVVNAGGSTASQMASAFAVGLGEDKCHLVFNENAPLLSQAELDWKEGIMIGANEKPVPSYWTDLTGWAGFACRNSNAIARAANLDGSTHKLTDEILAELVSKYAEANDGLNPDAIFVTFAQRLLLQKSRGTTVRTGARSSIEVTAAVPLEYDGIPIIATNSLTNTEAVWTAA
jgi:hypothetical protein